MYTANVINNMIYIVYILRQFTLENCICLFVFLFSLIFEPKISNTVQLYNTHECFFDVFHVPIYCL